MRKLSLIVLSLTLLAGLLSACGSNNKENDAASSPSGSASPSSSVSPSASASTPAESASPTAPELDMEQLTADYKEIGKMLVDKKDVKEIDAAYKEKFQPFIQYIDAGIKEGDPKIDENITFVLDHAATNEMNYTQVEEAVEKGLNWYFYFQLKDLVGKQVKTALQDGDADKASKLLEQAIAAYTQVLEPFVVKRDSKFNTTMKDTIAGAVIPNLREDVKASNLADYNVHRQMLDKTLIKAFTLASYAYAEKIPTVEKEELPKEMTEAYFLFLPVYTYLRGGSESDANAIKDAFGSGDATKVDTAKIKASIIASNTGKVKEYLETSQQELAEDKFDEARVHAMEGVMFLAAQETFLGAEYANAAVLGEAFLKAIDDKKADEAKKQSDAILAALAKL
ncbi:hypothetical protein [Cohnella luojiensis]|uniref:Lipoprotein n=1 Tax=Cohnella luojiensis TaxID=652876 RepID=A0A4Y8LTV0_9BACL|nr:hypothetical protein [Cohnella luojiensis]TFE25016.1 hypothetical protein E2980_14770 [Cohnella luojiensis]